MKANNNPKNRKGLLEYQRRQLELAELTEADSRKRRIQANLEKYTVDYFGNYHKVNEKKRQTFKRK